MSRVSKGKRQYLCKLYGVEDWIAYRLAVAKWTGWIREAIDAKPIKGFTQLAPDTGYYSGCRKLSSELDCEIAVHIDRVPVHRQYLEIKRGKHRISGTPIHNYGSLDKIVAYDLEADTLNIKCGQLRRESSIPGVVYTDHAIDAALMSLGIDQLRDLNIADTYPKSMEVFDEANFDRLIQAMANPA